MLVFVATIPLWVIGASLYGLYRRDVERADHSTVDDLLRVFHLVTVGTWLFFVVTELGGVVNPSVPRLLAFWFTATVLVTVGRAIARAVCRRSMAYVQNTVIVGAGKVGRSVALKLSSHPEYGLNVLGFVDADRPTSNGRPIPGVLGSPDDLPQIVDSLGVDRVIVAFSNDSHGTTLDLIRSLQRRVRIDIVPRLFEILGPGVELHTAEGLPLLGLPHLRLPPSALLLKRGWTSRSRWSRSSCSRRCSLSSRLRSSSTHRARLLPAGASGPSRPHLPHLEVPHDDRGRGDPQGRVRLLEPAQLPVRGLADVQDPGRPANHSRRTLLRSYSLDELPQLFNVLRGEMSLVGPRPLILTEDEHVVDWRRRRLDLKPGVTGLWQVLGRDGIPFEEMTTLDYVYVTSWSLFGDVKLILRTVPLLFRSHAG